VRSASSYPVTDLLARWREGDIAAREALVPLVYDELRRIARKCLAGQGSDQTLQPTALVHEAYLRLVRHDFVSSQSRAHFFAIAATMMRQILVDHARRNAAEKRGGRATKVVFEDQVPAPQQSMVDLIALDDALQQLATLDPRQCQIVELRFFGGLSIEETAELVNISPATTKREWATARIWLHNAINPGADA